MTERAGALVLAAALVLAPSAAGAQVHRWINERGVVTYANRLPQPDEVRAPVPAPALEPPAVPAAIPEARTARAATVDEVFDAAGIREQVAGLASRLAREFTPPVGRVSPKDHALVEQIVARAFAPERLHRLVRDDFARGSDAAKLGVKAAWFATPLGAKIAALERDESGVEREARMAAFAAALRATPPSARRREVIERLDWVSGTSDASARIVAAITRSVARAAAATAPAESRASARQIETQVAEMRARAAEALRESAVVSLLYSYRSLSDAELEQYLAFESSEAGRWYNTRLRLALVHTLERLFEETADAVFKAVPPERWAKS